MTRFAAAVVAVVGLAGAADAQYYYGGYRPAYPTYGTGYRYGGAYVGPYGGARAGGVDTHTYVGPGGTTVHTADAGGVRVGPYGGVSAGDARGVRVTTPYGATYSRGYAGGYRGGWGGYRYGRVGGFRFRR